MSGTCEGDGLAEHIIRGFHSAQVGKQMKLKVESAKGEAGERSYRIVS